MPPLAPVGSPPPACRLVMRPGRAVSNHWLVQCRLLPIILAPLWRRPAARPLHARPPWPPGTQPVARRPSWPQQRRIIEAAAGVLVLGCAHQPATVGLRAPGSIMSQFGRLHFPPRPRWCYAIGPDARACALDAPPQRKTGNMK